MSNKTEWIKRKIPVWLILAVLIISVISVYFIFFSGPRRIQLKVMCADSLIVPFEALAQQFETQNPNIDVTIEGHGSIQVIRHVTELGSEQDIVAVADYSLIPMLMYNNEIPGTRKDYANWYMIFTSNRLGLVYTNVSKNADIINNSNWYDILSQSTIRIGLPIPWIDSCGYRALMMCQLAEVYYGNATIFERVLGNFSPPITMTEISGITNISVPELLNPEKDITLRGSSILLSNLIESGDLDYNFEYESIAKQRGFEFLELPPEIDLSSVNFSEQYNDVLVFLEFQRFASVIPEFYGEPIRYALTIPANAPHSDAAIQFIEFLLSAEGQEVMSQSYQPLLEPIEIDNPENMPAELKTLFGI